MAGAELQVMTLSQFLSGPGDGEDGMADRCARADMSSTTVLPMVHLQAMVCGLQRQWTVVCSIYDYSRLTRGKLNCVCRFKDSWSDWYLLLYKTVQKNSFRVGKAGCGVGTLSQSCYFLWFGSWSHPCSCQLISSSPRIRKWKTALVLSPGVLNGRSGMFVCDKKGASKRTTEWWTEKMVFLLSGVGAEQHVATFHRIIMQGGQHTAGLLSTVIAGLKDESSYQPLFNSCWGSFSADIITPPLSSRDFLLCLCNQFCRRLLLKTIIALFMELLKPIGGFFL